MKSRAMPAWAETLLDALELGESGNPEGVLERVGKVADRSAPDTRAMWRRVLVVEGLAVLIPLAWFLPEEWQPPLPFVAFAIALCVLLMWAFIARLRWRGMQHTWARARLVAEIARSACATRGITGQATIDALAGVPHLQEIGRWIVGDVPAERELLAEARDRYLRDRVDDQLTYYRDKSRVATKTRHRLSRSVTLAVDFALGFAVFGFVLSLFGATDQLHSHFILGAFGVALPLLAIELQLFGSQSELDRRSGRYVQQIDFLESVRAKVASADDDHDLHDVVVAVERGLLGEVVEWFYQTELGEHYYRATTPGMDPSYLQLLARDRHPVLREIILRIEIGAGFVGRVVVGRLLVGAISTLLALLLIVCERSDTDPVVQSELREGHGRILSSTHGEPWSPDPERAERGLILIVHGLRDGVSPPTDDGAPHWMGGMQAALQEELGEEAPEIALVDWHEVAEPATTLHTTVKSWFLDQMRRFPPGVYMDWMLDIAAIRPQADRIGELLGYKIARALRRGDDGKQGGLHRDQPLHLIGHSAGGFVALYAALVLHELEMAPETLLVTMLDTPVLDGPLVGKEVLLEVLEHSPVDHYRSSRFTSRFVPRADLNDRYPKLEAEYSRIDIPIEVEDPYREAHSYAYRWYIESIQPEHPGHEEGFGRSPFAPGARRRPKPASTKCTSRP